MCHEGTELNALSMSNVAADMSPFIAYVPHMASYKLESAAHARQSQDEI